MKNITQHIGSEQKERDFFYGRTAGTNNRPLFSNDKFDNEENEFDGFDDEEGEGHYTVRDRNNNRYENDLDFSFDEEF